MSKVDKPWGYYVDLERSDDIVLKKLVVLPGQSISQQYHLYRDEDWYIHRGSCKIEVNELVMNKKAPFRIHIESGQTHRVMNTGKEELVIYETQLGKCSEDDIVRLDDQYGRQTF